MQDRVGTAATASALTPCGHALVVVRNTVAQ